MEHFGTDYPNHISTQFTQHEFEKPEKPKPIYQVLYCPTGRAACKAKALCGNALMAEGSLKLGSYVENFDGYSYRHYGCVTARQINNMTAALSGPDEIIGFHNLKPEDQARLTKAFEDGAIAPEDVYSPNDDIRKALDAKNAAAIKKSKAKARKATKSKKRKHVEEDSETEASDQETDDTLHNKDDEAEYGADPAREISVSLQTSTAHPTGKKATKPKKTKKAKKEESDNDDTLDEAGPVTPELDGSVDAFKSLEAQLEEDEKDTKKPTTAEQIENDKVAVANGYRRSARNKPHLAEGVHVVDLSQKLAC